jgi:PKD repeat protein
MRHPQTYRIDDKVIFTLLAISVLSLFFMAFRYKNRQLCSDFEFYFRTANKHDVAFATEPVFFSATTENTTQWSWNFGDGTPEDKTSGPFVSHTYKQPGSYTVRLTINGACQGVQTINVNSRETAGKKLLLRVQWPAEPLYAGREYYFTDSTTGAQTWGWYFGDEPKRVRQSLAYQFLEPGPHKVALVVNEDPENNKIERVFNVLPAQTLGSTAPGRRSPTYNTGAGGPARPIGDNTTTKPLTDYIDSVNDATRAPKIPLLSDNGLRISIININSTGYYEIRKNLLNNSFANCTIIFNNRPVSVEQLKENMKMHVQYGKSITVKQETDGSNYIKAIEITAELKPKAKFLVLGGKERKYPY